MTCPHCAAATIPHEGTKAGQFHCNDCGCCLMANGSQADGHPMCVTGRVSDDASEEDGAPVKRGPGRPRKEQH